MNLETRYWYLHDHQLFRALTRSELKEMCMITNFKSARKGEIIYFSHDDEQRVYFLKKGTLKIIEIDDNGNENVKDLIQKGDIFGEFTLNDVPSDEYAVALTESVMCCSFKLADFETVLQANPQLSLSYTKWMGFRFKRLQNRYTNLIFKDVKTRLIAFLNDWASKEGVKQDNQIILKNYLTHQDIASLVCSSRQTITALLNDFKEKDFIDYTRTEIILKNLPA